MRTSGLAERSTAHPPRRAGRPAHDERATGTRRLPPAAAAVVAVLAALATLHAQEPDVPAGSREAPLGGAGLVSASTRHLDLVGAASSGAVKPGERLSFRFAVTPKPGFYVYAPGATDYRVFQIRIEPSPLLRVHEPRYPESAMHFFEPLKEWVPVYGTTFELVQDITVGPTPRARTQLAKTRSLTVRGSVEYQACDARVCYLPTTIPFEWQVRVRTASEPPGTSGATQGSGPS
jgi:hypothetical protein